MRYLVMALVAVILFTEATKEATAGKTEGCCPAPPQAADLAPCHPAPGAGWCVQAVPVPCVAAQCIVPAPVCPPAPCCQPGPIQRMIHKVKARRCRQRLCSPPPCCAAGVVCHGQIAS